MNAQVATLQRATQMLAKVSSAPEAKKVMDMAAAAELYARKAKLGEESELYAHQIKIDAQELLGGFLARMEKNRGQLKNGPAVPPGNHGKPTLAANGISKKLSHQSQKLHKAKKEAPEIFEQVRNRKLPLTKVAEAIGKRDMTSDEKEAAALGQIRRAWTRWLESVVVQLNAGVCPKKKARETQPDLGLYANDPDRVLTKARIKSAGEYLIDVASEFNA